MMQFISPAREQVSASVMRRIIMCLASPLPPSVDGGFTRQPAAPDSAIHLMKPIYRVNKASLVVLVLSTLPLTAMAEIHRVSIKDSYFLPNDLVIAVGDTVRWTYIARNEETCDSYYGCIPGGTTHAVAADDGSFSSGAPSLDFSFDHVFQSAGEVLYHCPVHSAPGLDRNSNMNGRIVVQAGPAIFPINAGLNDSWFNPATPGQGFFITVFPEIQMMFLAWFTYDTQRPAAGLEAILGESGHRWLTAFGPYSGDTAMLEVELTRGGVFDAAVPAVQQGPDGTIEVVFSGCNAGMIDYNITSAAVSGQAPIERIALDNVPACRALADPE